MDKKYTLKHSSKKSEKEPSFITEIPLIVNLPQEVALLKRFDAARKVYNACLHEALKRCNLVRKYFKENRGTT